MEQRIIQSVLNRQIKEVKALLQQGADPNTRNEKGDTLLFLAIDKKSLPIVKLLVEHGADVHARGRYHQTPLIRAVWKNALTIVKYLLPLSDIEAEDKDGDTALIYAAEFNRLKIAKILIEHGAEINKRNRYQRTALHKAADRGYLEMVKLLIEHGADLYAKDKYGYTPYNDAVFQSHKEVQRYLLKHMHPLAHAIITEQYDLAEQLIKQEKFINEPTPEGSYPIHWAVRKNHLKLLKLLVEHGADVNVQDAQENTPLHEAIEKGKSLFLYLGTEGAPEIKEDNTAIVEFLLKSGADPNIPNKRGETPIFYVRTFSDAKLLLQYGANVHVKDKEGTPLIVKEAASSKPAVAYIEFLIKQGADVNAKDANGRSPLYFAVYHLNEELLELLLKNGADPYVVDNDNTSILRVAFWARNLYKDSPEWKQKAEKMIIKLLKILDLKKIAKVDKEYETNYGIIKAIIDNGLYDITKYMFEKMGFDPLYTDEEGNNLLHIVAKAAPYQDQHKITEYLIQKGVPVNAKNNDGITPLLYAVEENAATPENYELGKKAFEIIRLLVEAGADPNVGKEDYYDEVKNKTPLMYAAQKMYAPEDEDEGPAIAYKIIKLLLDAGADPNLKDSAGKTALHYLADSEVPHPKALEYLLQVGANINAQDNNGDTPLHWAIRKKRYDLVKMLVEAGADKTIKNYRKKTPCMITRSKKVKALLGC